MGRDLFSYSFFLFFKISTHTPAWGATMLMEILLRSELNFNSHARVGRDNFSEKLLLLITDFNSHARVGRDRFRHKSGYE